MKKAGKNKTIAFGLAIGLLCSGTTFAAAKEENIIAAGKNHSWEIGAELSSFTYEEPGIMEESGALLGIAGSYTYRNDWMLKIEGVFKYGQIDYTGATIEGEPVAADNIDDYIVEVRGLSGYGFPLSESTVLTPFVGLGYRYLSDDLGAASSAGYGRESNYLYSPIGIETLTELQNGWFAGLAIEYDIFWHGIQTNHMSDLEYGLNDIENDQNRGYGFRGSIKFQNSRFVIEPFIRYWKIDDSDPEYLTYFEAPVTVIIEPENNSTEVGIKLTVKF